MGIFTKITYRRICLTRLPWPYSNTMVFFTAHKFETSMNEFVKQIIMNNVYMYLYIYIYYANIHIYMFLYIYIYYVTYIYIYIYTCYTVNGQMAFSYSILFIN